MAKIEFKSDTAAVAEIGDDLAILVANTDETRFQELDGLAAGALSKAVQDKKDAWVRAALPAGFAAGVCYVYLQDKEDARIAGAKLAAIATKNISVWTSEAEEFALGFGLRAYRFDRHRTTKTDIIPNLTVFSDTAAFEDHQALIDGVHTVRDLVNEPANVLTTEAFADHVMDMAALGLEITILDEKDLAEIGMNAVLAVGQGSSTPSKVAIMHWKGADGCPVALVGKGVVFDTGGISIKPAANMHEMTADMGGAATVVGTMETLAKKKSKANVVGIIGLVENMPDGKAMRPGDIIHSLKGDTIEILNTDAEGRLVLADLLWYVQEEYTPAAVIDLATLTGAMLMSLGYDYAGLFSNDEQLIRDLLGAARAADEGMWHMPMSDNLAKTLKSRSADMANIGSRWGGAIVAAEFLKKFVKPDTAWAHLDIAGAAYRHDDDNPFAAKGATGWGVATLDRYINTYFNT